MTKLYRVNQPLGNHLSFHFISLHYERNCITLRRKIPGNMYCSQTSDDGGAVCGVFDVATGAVVCWVGGGVDTVTSSNPGIDAN